MPLELPLARLVCFICSDLEVLLLFSSVLCICHLQLLCLVRHSCDSHDNLVLLAVASCGLLADQLKPLGHVHFGLALPLTAAIALENRVGEILALAHAFEHIHNRVLNTF